MSSDYHVYVGPFLFCKSPLATQREQVDNCCNNTRCRQYLRFTSTKFCGDCGKPTGRGEKVKQSAQFGWADAVAAMETTSNPEALSHATNGSGPIFKEDGYEIFPWIGNDGNWEVGRRDFGFSEHSPADPSLLDDAAIAKERAEFALFFREQIAALTRLYGDGNVEVKWGIFNYWY